jgi:mono/diheme cytochrome c family protein
MDIARRIDHQRLDANVAPPPSPTAAYGRFVGKLCMGCHGETYGGGPIPGAPPSMPVPLNLTPHASGLKGWTFEDFDHSMKTGLRKNGQKMADFMPRDAINSMNDVEKRALWAFLQSLPAKPFGER